jgi:hypothetical protein
MNKIEISPYRNLLVYQKGYTPDFVLETITDKKLKGLRIFAQLKEQRLKSIDFLKEFDFLESLDITSVDDFDFSSLKELKNFDALVGVLTNQQNQRPFCST